MKTAWKRMIAAVAAVALLSWVQNGFVRLDAKALGASGEMTGSTEAGPPDVIPLGESDGSEGPEDPDNSEYPEQEEIPVLGTSTAAFSIAAFSSDTYVTSYAELKSAIQSRQYDTIYLDNDIQMGGNIQITAPTTVVIDAQDHTIDETAVLRNIEVLSGGAGSQITLKNARITGYDYYGFLCVKSTISNIELVYDNVVYDGPQPVFHWGKGSGKTVFRDCEIYIRSRSGSNPSQELFQGAWVEFEGDTRVEQSTTDNSTFFLEVGANARSEYGGSDRGIVLRQGASLDIVSEHYMVYCAAGNGAIVLEPDSSFHYSGKSGGTYSSQALNYVSIGQDAEMLTGMHGARGNAGYRSLNINGSFIMEPGSVFECSTVYAGVSEAALYVSGTVAMSQPERFVAHSNAQAIRKGTVTWTVDGINAVNYLNGSNQEYVWNIQRDDLPSFGMAISNNGDIGGVDNAVTSIRGQALSSAIFKPYTDLRQLALGNYPGGLSANPVTQSASIDGETAAGASVDVSYYPSGPGGAAAFTASGISDGTFSIPIPDGQSIAPASELSVVAIRAGVGGLAVERAFNIRDEGRATLTVTEALDFGTQPIPASQGILLARTHPMLIRVDDTSTTARNYKLMAAETCPLTGPTTVDQAFVYKTGGEQISLNGQDQLIASFSNPGGSANWSHQLDLPDNEGIVISVSPGEVLTGEYYGVITWTLVDA